MVLAVLTASAFSVRQTAPGAVEAPSGFNDLTNGYVAQAEFDASRSKFDESEKIADGLGPVYNAESCAACHGSPISGGASQVTELRAGHLDAFGLFVSARGGSLVHDRAISPDIQAHVSDLDNIRALRASPANQLLQDILNDPDGRVPVLVK